MSKSVINTKQTPAADVNSDLEWIPIDAPSVPFETTTEKFMRKFNENPFVPIGCLTTATVLCIGLYSFRSGNTRLSQMMMRARVAAQGFTLVALTTGVLLSFNSDKE